jgi:dihydrofolate reductase
MRKVSASLFITVDNVVESPHEWSFDLFDDDMSDEMNRQLDLQDTVLLGRVTYQEWAAYWPTAEDGFKDYINPTPKYVFSKTLTHVDEWENSILVQDDLSDAIRNLKEQTGKQIGVSGSPTLVNSLLQLDLLDELILCIYPIIAGKGQRLFQGFSNMKRLNLVDSKRSQSGIIIATYARYQQS